MFLKKLILNHFRSFSQKTFIFSKKITVFTGPNASGKTNILEALFLIATGKSFRAKKESEIIAHQNQLARISAEIEKDGEEEILEVILTDKKFTQKKIFTKRYLVNNLPKKLMNFVGRLKICLFWPEDLKLVTDSPSIRRQYLDFVLTQTNKIYFKNLQIYENGLRRRNKILERIKEGQAKKEELLYWNNLLIETGSFITKTRSEYLNFLNQHNFLISNYLFTIFYDKSLISHERLNQYALEEIESATTLVGPHRDDFILKIQNNKAQNNLNEKDLSRFGSRGEQRLGVLWLKLGELFFLKEKSQGEEPILLLDDLFSEFDQQNRELIFKHLGSQQTLITTTDLHLIQDQISHRAQIINLE